jgi:glutamate-1-semialdehyde 2,1-aminomutase
VTFASQPPTDYATYTGQHDAALSRLLWLYGANRGLFLAPGRPQQWTLSVAHGEADVERYVSVFGELCRELGPESGRRTDDRAPDHLATA